MVQWLRLHALKPGYVDSIPGQGNKIPNAVQSGKKKKKEKEKKKEMCKMNAHRS